MMAIKSEDIAPGLSKADNLVNWLDMEPMKAPIPAVPMTPQPSQPVQKSVAK